MNIQIKWEGLRSVFVGNLRWWTTDKDIYNACRNAGVGDIESIEIYDDRRNGRSMVCSMVAYLKAEVYYNEHVKDNQQIQFKSTPIRVYILLYR